MSARSFENYIIEKLGATNEQNDYLANFKTMGEWIDAGVQIDNFPYPNAEESPAINETFDNLFDVLETKQDDAGNVMLYEGEGEYNLDNSPGKSSILWKIIQMKKRSMKNRQSPNPNATQLGRRYTL